MRLCAYRLKAPHKKPCYCTRRRAKRGKEIRKKKNEKWKREWKLYQCTRAAISRPPLRIYNTITANCISLYFSVFLCTLSAFLPLFLVDKVLQRRSGFVICFPAPLPRVAHFRRYVFKCHSAEISQEQQLFPLWRKLSS